MAGQPARKSIRGQRDFVPEPIDTETDQDEVADDTEPNEPEPDQPKEIQEDKTDKSYMDAPGAPKDGLILGPGEPLKVDGDDAGDNVNIRLRCAVYRAFKPMGSKRWGYTLEYPKGHLIPKTIIESVD